MGINLRCPLEGFDCACGISTTQGCLPQPDGCHFVSWIQFQGMTVQVQCPAELLLGQCVFGKEEGRKVSSGVFPGGGLEECIGVCELPAVCEELASLDAWLFVWTVLFAVPADETLVLVPL